MPARIHILIGGHLSTAPRAQKEALALIGAGHEVRVSGVWFDGEAVARDRRLISRTGLPFVPALDFRSGASPLRRLQVRWRGRSARRKFARTGTVSPPLFGYGARELLDAALDFGADLTIVHSEAGLWAGAELAARGCNLGVDFEDWFSHDLPASARRHRPVAALEHLERRLARLARYVLAPSRAMSEALAQAFDIEPPTVVYNAFPATPPRAAGRSYRDRLNTAVPSLHWFSQTIGSDRGLELLFGALPLLKNRVQVCLRGACSSLTRRWLDERIPRAWRRDVAVLPPVPNDELPARIAEHDIGLALESGAIVSRDLSVSNKLFQYLEAGLAVIATDTQGQREVLDRCAAAGILLPEATPGALAAAVDALISQPGYLARARRDARAAAAGPFAWEPQRARLVAAAAEALAPPGTAGDHSHLNLRRDLVRWADAGSPRAAGPSRR